MRINTAAIRRSTRWPFGTWTTTSVPEPGGGGLLGAVGEWEATHPGEELPRSWSPTMVTSGPTSSAAVTASNHPVRQRHSSSGIRPATICADGWINNSWQIVSATPTIMDQFGITPPAYMQGAPLTSPVFDGTYVDPGPNLYSVLSATFAAQGYPDIATNVTTGLAHGRGHDSLPGLRPDTKHRRCNARLLAATGVMDRRRRVPVSQYPRTDLGPADRRDRQPNHPADTQPIPARRFAFYSRPRRPYSPLCRTSATPSTLRRPAGPEARRIAPDSKWGYPPATR